MTIFRLVFVSVFAWPRSPGESDKAYRSRVGRARLRHARSERVQRKAYQRAHGGSLRGYRPVTFVRM